MKYKHLREGAIALFDNKLIVITKIDYADEPVMVKKGVFGRLVPSPNGETKRVVKTVWWKDVGDESDIITTNQVWSSTYDWDTNIINAAYILHQTGWILKNHPALLVKLKK